MEQLRSHSNLFSFAILISLLVVFVDGFPSLVATPSSICKYDTINVTWNTFKSGDEGVKPVAWIHVKRLHGSGSTVVSKLALYEPKPPKEIQRKPNPVIECLFSSPDCTVSVKSAIVPTTEFADGHTFIITFDQDTASPDAGTKVILITYIFQGFA